MGIWQNITKHLGFRSRRTLGYRGDGDNRVMIRGEYYSTQSREIRRWSDAIRNVPLVGAAIRLYINTCSQAEWSVLPAEEEGERGEEIASLVKQLLFESPEFSWQETVRRAAMYKFFGFSIQEWTAYRRQDGIVAFSEVASRSQSTIHRWKVSPSGKVEGVYQDHDIFVFIPRDKIVYVADTALNDEPEGIGLLKSVEEPLARLAIYERLEKIGLGNDLRGILVGRAPIEELRQAVKLGRLTVGQAQDTYRHISNFAQNLTRSPDQSIILDSAVHYGEMNDGSQRLSNIYKQDVQLMQGGSSSLPEANMLIERLNREIARGLGAEFLLLGEGNGSYALGKEKTSQYSLMVDEGLRTLAEAFHRDLIRQLFRLNGWDMRYLPTLRAEEAQFVSTSEKIDAVVRLNALDRSDPAVNELRGELGVPPVEEMEPPMEPGDPNDDGDESTGMMQ